MSDSESDEGWVIFSRPGPDVLLPPPEPVSEEEYWQQYSNIRGPEEATDFVTSLK